jgi:eukaryotic-like serine/threonine-protein kinase
MAAPLSPAFSPVMAAVNAHEVSRCVDCGVPLPEYWPKGLCAQCALDGALDASEGASAEPEANQHGRFGEYELLEEIARGGMGVIYRARQIRLNRIVALKMILAGQFASKQEVLRFRSEAEAAANLQHPNIVRIHETGERDGHHYFSMDYVAGRTLADIVRDGPLPAQRAAKYVRRIAEAIHYAHSQGVLHRDLKPSNVVIDVNDEPRIADFGLAKRMRDDFGVTVTGQVLGSPNFMPPEQTSTKSGKVGPASDVYGVGAILYCLLTGRPPFHAETIEDLLLLLRDAEPVSPRLLNPSVPRDLETICLKCLEKDPARRYPTAQALADELGRFIRDEPIHARPQNATAKLWRWCRRRPAVTALSASVLLLLILVAISSSLAAWRVNRARASEQKANRDLRETVSSLEFQRAENFFRNGDAGTAVAHLAAMLRRDPSNHVASTRLVSALVHRDWALRTAVTMQHTNRIRTLCLSPDGRHVLSAGRDQTARIWDASNGKALATLQHTGEVFCAHYNASGTRIVTASADGSAQIWDSITGEPRTPPLQHTGKVYWAEFSADERSVVTASADRTACIWDAATGALKHRLRKHTSHVIRAHFNADNQTVVTAGSHGSLRIWNAETGEMLWRVEDRNSPLLAMDLSRDGRRLIAVCYDESVRLWDLETRTEIELRGNKAVVHATFSPDSRLLVTTSHDTTARFWDVNTGLPVDSPLPHDGTVELARFSPDGQKIVTLSKDHSARIRDVRTRQPLCQPIFDPENFTHADFSPDGLRLVAAGWDGRIHVWDLRPRRFTGLEARFESGITTIDFSVDGECLLATSFDGAVHIFDARRLTTLSSLKDETGLYLAKLSPDGKRVFTACAGKMRLWDWRKGVVVAGPMEHATKIWSVNFNPKGDQIVTGDSDGVARVWNMTTWAPITPPLMHSGAVAMARFGPDGRLVATASEDHTARVWNAATGEPVTPPLVHKDHVKSVDFSPDGKKILTASTDDTARLWDLQTGEPIIPPLQHTRLVERAAFSPDGNRIITGSLDYTARIWDARTGGALTPPLKHDYSLIGVSFTRDGESALTACWNGTLRAWNTRNGQPISESFDPGEWSWRVFALDPVGRRMAVGGKDSIVRLWHVPESPTPVPEWFLTFAETVAGIRLGDRGQLEFIPEIQYEAAIHGAKSTGKNDFYGRLAQWFLADPAERDPAPF